MADRKLISPKFRAIIGDMELSDGITAECGASWPICATMIMANRNARIKLKIGPAAITAMRDNTG